MGAASPCGVAGPDLAGPGEREEHDGGDRGDGGDRCARLCGRGEEERLSPGQTYENAGRCPYAPSSPNFVVRR
ncbi:hypothetical protein SLNWT_1546 [Streptomyces albus]|uniref:Uncharacterized protein n=1 Tax=Streptomyces albus (strain ATCC 21838 / DSM 41398 / FERM P-419 / JCM 4703 / NBRC 107858) TaxID=1081613 RepID=A0A0B5EV38_STRA4|nr:hypothetical protein SLNWT_1546 [Streptomyces albus]AOU76239.1 hypothetical protein SLNHY_1548 [Streptomyces albus]AYN32024.1 hypothetical protein DUI70_1523 [Streptomyces albus]